MQTQPQVVEKPDAIDFEYKEGKLRFEDVSFAYNEKEILKDFNLEI